MPKVHRKQVAASRQSNRSISLRTGAPIAANPVGKVFGYARVSRDDQNLDMQLALLRNAGVADANLFVEKISAVHAKRPQFNLLLKMLEPGDSLFIYAFNRLVRDLKQLLGLVDEFKAMPIILRSVSEPHIDPFTTSGRLLISVTGAVDENELGRIRDRTRDGMAELKRQGMYLGRPELVSTADVKKMLAMRARGVQVTTIARQYGIKPSTVYARTNQLKRRKGVA